MSAKSVVQEHTSSAVVASEGVGAGTPATGRLAARCTTSSLPLLTELPLMQQRVAVNGSRRRFFPKDAAVLLSNL